MPGILKTSKICFNCKKSHDCLKLEEDSRKRKKYDRFFAISLYKESNKNE